MTLQLPVHQEKARKAPPAYRPSEPLERTGRTAILQLQRTVGNRAVGRLLAATRPQDKPGDRVSLQRQPPSRRREPPIAPTQLDSIRNRLTQRQTSLNQFLSAAKQDVDNIRNHFVFVNGVYRRTYGHHALVVAQAKAVAESKQAWVDFAFGVGVGISIGLMSEALIAGRLAEAAYETVAEVGAELAEGGVARFVKPEVPKAALIPELAPELKQIRSLQLLDDLNVLVIQLAVPGTFVFTDPLVQAERLSAELRLIEASAAPEHRKLTDDQLRQKFAKLADVDRASAQAEVKIGEARAKFDGLRSAYFARPVITDERIEQDIWIPWVAAQDIETFFAPTVFSPVIRNHLRDIGMSRRLGAHGLPHRDRIMGELWPNNPSTAEERAVVASYRRQKDAAAAEARQLPAFWNRVFLQAP